MLTTRSDGEQPDEIDLREGSAEYHHFGAVGELERGENLTRGLIHLADLLTFDPRNAQWLAIVDRYAEAMGDDAERALDLGDDRYYATEALRARLVARRGGVVDATSTVIQVARVKPDVGYLAAWVLDWVEPAGVFESLGDRVATMLLRAAVHAFPEQPELTAARARDLLRFVALAQRLVASYPRDPVADRAVSAIFRKAGLYDKAIEHARSCPPSWETALAEGLALRAAGHREEAVAAFERALELWPDNPTPCLEAGDLYFDAEAWDQALPWYERALALVPDHPWAVASACWCRLGPVAAAPELGTLAAAGNERARSLLASSWPYEGYLPRPSDIAAGVLDQIRGKLGASLAPDGVVSITLAQVEGPSNRAAFRLGAGVDLDLSYERVATPDPREPIERFGFALWHRSGEMLEPAVDPPPADVSERIVALAAEPYAPDQNWAAASRVADNLGPAAAAAILACVAHPPPPPASWQVLDWIPRVQLAAAQVLAHLDEGPWLTSVSRRALYTLLLGPLDWSTEAAIIAVTHLAAVRPAVATDVHEALTKLWRARPESGKPSWEVALHYHWQRVPGLFPSEVDEIRSRLDRLLAST